MKYTQKETPELFNSIAKRYDSTNRIISLFLYPLIMRKYTHIVLQPPSVTKILDIGAGTGEISFRILQKAKKDNLELPQCTLLDLSENMLSIAKTKQEKLPEHMQKNISIVLADAFHLPFQDNFFCRTTSSFLLRNVKEYEGCFKEALRVLKPQGKAFFLELSRPKNKFCNIIHKLFLTYIVPPLGGLLTHDREAYDYLQHSIMNFPDDEALRVFGKNAGSRKISIYSIFWGIARVIILEK